MSVIDRRQFVASSLAAVVAAKAAGAAPAEATRLTLPREHREAVRRRKRRIVVQQDVYWVILNYGKRHPGTVPPFGPFRDVAFSYVDETGSQIDAIWWDIGGNSAGAVPGSKVAPWKEPELVRRWREAGVDWAVELINETRRRRLEVFWNHRISEIDILPEGGHAREPDPLKRQHPDWVLPASWWPHGVWNLASAELREHKVALLREIVTRYDLDGLQIDFARHVPCLPVGKQWELREQVTIFMEQVRRMLLDEAARRGRPLLLAARVPQTLAGCEADGFDVAAWSDRGLVDILTLGSRSMDVDVEGIRAAVGPDVQLQPCFDDHHATDGYRYAPLENLRGVFANHFQRGANSVVVFNWSVAKPELAETIGAEIAPLTHQAAFQEIGDPRTMAGKNKVFAVERRGGYPWADGFFNRNDTAPLPKLLEGDGVAARLRLQISDAPASGARLALCCVLFGADAGHEFAARFNGVALDAPRRDADWKDAQIFSPRPQPTSGGKGVYKINPNQRLLRLQWDVPLHAWKAGRNEVEIGLIAAARTASAPANDARKAVQIEKIEAHLTYESPG